MLNFNNYYKLLFLDRADHYPFDEIPLQERVYAQHRQCGHYYCGVFDRLAKGGYYARFHHHVVSLVRDEDFAQYQLQGVQIARADKYHGVVPGVPVVDAVIQRDDGYNRQ